MFSILLNSLLDNKRVFLFLFFFYPLYLSFLAIPLVTENTKLKIELVISTGTPTTKANEAIETSLFVVDKTSKVLSN